MDTVDLTGPDKPKKYYPCEICCETYTSSIMGTTIGLKTALRMVPSFNGELEEEAASAVATSHKTLALASFINDVPPAIRGLLRARDIGTLEKAITVAIEEE
ncbi:hypothetical protein QTP88_018853 [Uroleucon formosanum]